MLLPRVATDWLPAMWVFHGPTCTLWPYRYLFRELFQFGLPPVQDLTFKKPFQKQCLTLTQATWKKNTSFYFIWTNHLWINLINLYFCHGETQWATDAYSPLPHHSQFFMNLSYMPSTVCFPSKSFLACIIVPPLEIIHTFDHLYWSSLDILQLFYIFFVWGERIGAAWNIRGARTKGHLDNHKHYFSKKI